MRVGLLLLTALACAGSAPTTGASPARVPRDRPAASALKAPVPTCGARRGSQRGPGPRRVRPIPPLPKPETAAENQALTWAPVTQTSGPIELWGVPDGMDGFVVCDALSRPMMIERLALTSRLRSPAGQPVKVAGTLTRDANGTGAFAPSRVVARARATLAGPIPRLKEIASAVAQVDLGPLSHPSYAQATSEQCRSPQWTSEVTQALLSSPAHQTAVSPDGRLLVAVLRGPRMPPGKGIVFRYLQVCVVFDLRRWSVTNLLVDVEGWVEE